MNPIDEINSRIQDITARIREIQNLGRRPPGQAAASGTTKHPAAFPAGSGAKAAGSPNPSDLAANGTAGFQSLLEQALSNPADTSSAGSANLDSLLGSGNSQSDTLLSADSAARLQDYQKLLIQAIQELGARKGDRTQGSTP